MFHCFPIVYDDGFGAEMYVITLRWFLLIFECLYVAHVLNFVKCLFIVCEKDVFSLGLLKRGVFVICFPSLDSLCISGIN